MPKGHQENTKRIRSPQLCLEGFLDATEILTVACRADVPSCRVAECSEGDRQAATSCPNLPKVRAQLILVAHVEMDIFRVSERLRKPTNMAAKHVKESSTTRAAPPGFRKAVAGIPG